VLIGSDNVAAVDGQILKGFLLALAMVLSACTQTTVTDTSVDLVEIPEAWASVDNPLVMAIRASESTESPSRAVDGSEATSWVSGADAPQWVELDLGSPVDVASITLVVDQSPPGLTVHEITAGAHDVPGMSIAVIEDETDRGDRLRIPIDKTVQFIRITTTTSPSWIAWAEIEIEVGS